MDNHIIVPYVILIDTREQAPYSFRGFTADAPKRHVPLIIPVRSKGLRTGDYSIEGLEDRVAVERKSLPDLYGSLGRERERFERELVRLDEMDYAAIVIEAGWPSIISRPPPNTEMRPKTIYRTAIAWQQRYPRVHWWACDTRNFAERTTLRILQRFWIDNEKDRRR